MKKLIKKTNYCQRLGKVLILPIVGLSRAENITIFINNNFIKSSSVSSGLPDEVHLDIVVNM